MTDRIHSLTNHKLRTTDRIHPITNHKRRTPDRMDNSLPPSIRRQKPGRGISPFTRYPQSDKIITPFKIKKRPNLGPSNSLLIPRHQ